MFALRVPLKLFWLRSSISSFEQLKRSSGMLPENLLFPKDKYLRFNNCPNSSGIFPVNLLLVKVITRRHVQLIILDGMHPSRRFSFKVKFFKLYKNPVSFGSGPVSELKPMDKYVKFHKFVIVEGSHW